MIARLTTLRPLTSRITRLAIGALIATFTLECRKADAPTPPGAQAPPPGEAASESPAAAPAPALALAPAPAPAPALAPAVTHVDSQPRRAIGPDSSQALDGARRLAENLGAETLA
nr:hypothetical protein [Fibrobacterota bacterium]